MLLKFILVEGRAFSQSEGLFYRDIHAFYIQYRLNIQFFKKKLKKNNSKSRSLRQSEDFFFQICF